MRRGMMVALLGVVLTACGLTDRFQMPDDGPPIPITNEAAASLEQKAADAAQAAQASGASTITVSQEEITSFVALRLESAAAEAGTSVEIPLVNPQIYFKEDGTLALRGDIEFQGRSQPIRVVARPSAANGELVMDIVDGRIGPVPVPGPILDQVEGMLAEAILQTQNYAQLNEVRVEAGTLTLSGQPAP